MKKLIFIVCCFCYVPFLFAQQKMIQYDKDFVFKDGVYLLFADFKNNHPIPPSKIIFKSNQGDRDYLKIALSKSTFIYMDSFDKEQEIKTNSIWGYCSNGTVYVNYGTDFNRMVIIGSLSHFIATIAVPSSYDPFAYGYGYYTPSPRYMYVSTQFILDYETGKIIEFNLDNIEILLQRDNELYAEFSALKKRQKRDSIFLYLRKYNEKHPIFFPG